jgi:Mrp family chromosome partitioning ATPase
MSKHFELMQQMEREESFSIDSTAAGILASRAAGSGQPRWASEEALRLVQQIVLTQTQEPPRVVVFAGIDHGSGCSQICISVAETLAKNLRGRVCLVEANFRSPGLPGLLGTTNHLGLTESLLHAGPMSSYAKPVEDNLWLLSSGTLAADSPNLLNSERLSERLKELRKEFDFVIVDAPPLTRYADSVVLGKLSDGLVLVLEADATRREAAAAVVANLRSSRVPILAGVLNKRTFPIPENIYKRL